MNERKAILLLVLAALLASTGGLLIKSIHWDPMAIVSVRSTLAALTIFAYLRKPKFTWDRYQILGGFAFAGVAITFVVANKYTTAANTVFLQFSAPVFVAIFGIFFLGERVTKLGWITVATVLFGMTLFFLDELTPGGMLGNAIAILSALCFAWLVLLLRKQKDGSPMESVLLGGLIAGAVGLPFVFDTPLALNEVPFLLLLGIVQLGLYYVLYSIAIKYVTALEAILISTLEPIFNPIWVLFLHGERPGPWAMMGGVIVLGAVSFQGISMTRKTSNKSTN